MKKNLCECSSRSNLKGYNQRNCRDNVEPHLMWLFAWNLDDTWYSCLQWKIEFDLCC